jgi:hypothetical protein
MHPILRADAYCFFCSGTFRGTGSCASCFGAGSGTFRDKCNRAYCFCRAYTLRDGAFYRPIALPQSCIRGFRQGRPRFHQRPDIQTRPQQCWNIADPDSQNARPTGLRRLQSWAAEFGLHRKWTKIPMMSCDYLYCV